MHRSTHLASSFSLASSITLRCHSSTAFSSASLASSSAALLLSHPHASSSRCLISTPQCILHHRHFASAPHSSRGTPMLKSKTPAAATGDPSSDSSNTSSTSRWKQLIHESDVRRKRATLEKREALRGELRDIAGHNHQEVHRTQGKPYTTPIELVHPLNSLKIPTSPAKGAFKTTMIDGTTSVEIPSSLSSSLATLLVIGYHKQAYVWGESWMEVMRKEFGEEKGEGKVNWMQFSIISNRLIGTLFGSYMTRKFAEDIPLPLHKEIGMLRSNPFSSSDVDSTYVKEAPLTEEEKRRKKTHELAVALATKTNQPLPPPLSSRPLRSAIQAEPGWSIRNQMLTHVFLIDKEGRIRWKACGPVVEGEEKILKKVVRELVEEEGKAIN